MEVEWEYLSKDIKEAELQLIRADNAIKSNKTFFFVVKKGTFDNVELKAQNLNHVSNKLKIEQSKENELPLV